MSEERARMIAEREAKARRVRLDNERMRAVLVYLADPENWLGDPASQESTLYGHDTPWELAFRVLSEVES